MTLFVKRLIPGSAAVAPDRLQLVFACDVFKRPVVLASNPVADIALHLWKYG
jgi:hypothetical protein